MYYTHPHTYIHEHTRTYTHTQSQTRTVTNTHIYAHTHTLFILNPFSFLLDGFPRNIEQAVELDNFLKRKGWELTKVISFNCKDDTLKKRIAGRFIHVASGRIYHEGTCITIYQ